MDLPRDIILDVLTRLPVKSLSEICCISKTSLNIIDNPFFATLHTSRLLNSAVNSTTAGEVQLMLLAHSWSSRDDKFLTALQSLKYNDKNGLTKSRRCKTNILSRVVSKLQKEKAKTCAIYESTKSSTNILISERRMAGTEVKRIINKYSYFLTDA
ncbi:hypothetical protein ACE6H2_017491 [Prunus campanulata]